MTYSNGPSFAYPLTPFIIPDAARASDGPREAHEAPLASIQASIQSKKMDVLTAGTAQTPWPMAKTCIRTRTTNL